MKSARQQLVELLGGMCMACRITDFDVLQLDHVNDDGSEDRRRFKNQVVSMYSYYLKRPDEAKSKLQVLCANHNWKKRHFGERERASKVILHQLLTTPMDKLNPTQDDFDQLTEFDRAFFKQRIELWIDALQKDADGKVV